MKNHLKATGLIVEYNPFHNGHIYHIQKAKELHPDSVIIAVMSPHFVQRGEPAFINKWERVKVALNHGVDCVIELPTVFAIQSADYFAKAGVDILALMGVSNIVFGSETADIDHILETSDHAPNPKLSYASNTTNPKSSNDILGHQYILNAQKYQIQAQPIQRTNSYHDLSVDHSISSASAIRNNFRRKPIAHTTPMNLSSLFTHDLNEYSHLIKMSLYEKPSVLSSRLMVSEGIENLLIKNRKKSLESIIENSISKKYTRSRIQRTLIALMLGLNKEDALPLDQVRVLGMNSLGKKYLAQLRDSDHNPVVSFKHYKFKDIEIKSTALYALVKEQAYQDYLNQAEIQNLIIIED